MPIVYFDSSALVKLVLEEEYTEVTDESWRAADPAVSSQIAYPEVRASLAAAHRDKRLNRSEYDEAKRLFERYWRLTGRVDPTLALLSAAGDLAEQYSLRGYDAVHLASALVFREDPLLVVSWDDRMRSGALSAGLALIPR